MAIPSIKYIAGVLPTIWQDLSDTSWWSSDSKMQWSTADFSGSSTFGTVTVDDLKKMNRSFRYSPFIGMINIVTGSPTGKLWYGSWKYKDMYSEGAEWYVNNTSSNSFLTYSGTNTSYNYINSLQGVLTKSSSTIGYIIAMSRTKSTSNRGTAFSDEYLELWGYGNGVRFDSGRDTGHLLQIQNSRAISSQDQYWGAIINVPDEEDSSGTIYIPYLWRVAKNKFIVLTTRWVNGVFSEDEFSYSIWCIPIGVSEYLESISTTEPYTPSVLGKEAFMLSNRFSARAYSNGCAIYPLTTEKVQALFSNLWNKTLWESIKDTFITDDYASIYTNILSLRYFYGLNNYKTSDQYTSDECYVTIGSWVFNGSSTAITAYPMLTEYFSVTSGNISISEYFNSYLDYAPYTSVELYIPFYGWINLDVARVMNKQLQIQYNINLVSGNCLIIIFITDDEGETWTFYDQYNTTLGYDIPVNAESTPSAGLKLVSTVLSGAQLFIAERAQSSHTVGVPKLDVENAKIATDRATTGISAAQGAVTSPPAKVHTSQPTAGAENGVLGSFSPMVRTTRPIKLTPDEIDEFYNSQSCTVATLTTCEGFTQIYDVKSSDTSLDGIPAEEKDEIISLLKSGVFI